MYGIDDLLNVKGRDSNLLRLTLVCNCLIYEIIHPIISGKTIYVSPVPGSVCVLEPVRRVRGGGGADGPD